MAASRDMAAHIAVEDELLNRTVYPLNWPHDAPDRSFSVEGAHYAWQRHASCPVDSCARLRAALEVLDEAGVVVRDPRNSRNLP